MSHTILHTFATPRVSVDRRADGTVLLRSDDQLGAYSSSMAHIFRRGSELHPERVLADGNHNLGQVIAFGGSLYIDDGKPAPGHFERTIEALRPVPPTVYYNVPAGYVLLAPRLEEDHGVR